MAIDIDEFLQKYTAQESSKASGNNSNNSTNYSNLSSITNRYNSSNQQPNETNNSLDIESYADTNLDRIKELSTDSSLETLEKFYNEVKEFDKNLANKFLNLGKKGQEVLEKVGSKYSQDFLNREKSNIEKLNSDVNYYLNSLEKSIREKDLSKIFENYNYLLSYYRNFPNGFYKEKTDLGIQVRNKEKEINQLLINYKNENLPSVRDNINYLYSQLKSSIDESNVEGVERNLLELETFMEKMPALFKPELLNERYHVSILFERAEKFLQSYYENKFNQIENRINTLIENFRQSYLESDLDNLIFYYESILIEFEYLPNTNLERKTSLYNKVNGLYTKINDLIVKENMNLFLETYNAGKVIEEAKEYIKDSQKSKNFNRDTLMNLRNRIEALPDKFREKKEDVLKNIDQLLGGDFSGYQRRSRESEAVLEQLYQKLKSSKSPREKKNLYRLIKDNLEILDIEKEKKDKILQKVKRYI